MAKRSLPKRSGTSDDPPTPPPLPYLGPSLESVSEWVMGRLGTPPGEHDVSVHVLYRQPGAWRYRVNVIVPVLVSEMGLRTWRVAHSYFIECDGAGGITARPPVSRKYR